MAKYLTFGEYSTETGLTLEEIQDRINSGEILYADDIICMSNDTKSLNRLIQDIKIAAEMHGAKLNYNKCAFLNTGSKSDI